MMKKITFLYWLFVSFLIVACQTNKNIDPYSNLSLVAAKLPVDSLASTIRVGGCQYKNGELKLMLQGVTLGTSSPHRHELIFLKQTNKGRYFHVVLNDSIHISDNYRNIKVPLADGSYHLEAFVVQPHHESMKGPSAFMTRAIQITNGQLSRSFSSDVPRLVYNAPLGQFKSTEQDSILLDFYLMNTTVSKVGNYVKLRIGNQKEFRVEEWKPYYIVGLGVGKHKIELELYNSENTLIYGPVSNYIECLSEAE